MKVISFETIKRNAEYAFAERMNVGGSFANDTLFLALIAATGASEKPRNIVKEWYDYGVNLIRKWDIRNVKKLIELFPSCVPNYCTKLPIGVDYNDKGNWCVIFGT